LEQIKKQLNKLIDVIKVTDLTRKEYINRELVLLNVSMRADTKEKIIQAVDSVGAEILDVGRGTITVEETGDSNKINALMALLKPFGIKEVVRTGKIAIQTEGEKRDTDKDKEE
ncbi:MAG: acetolactate synthase small subunit, partial [Candidatus Omnitrophota bacterium]